MTAAAALEGLSEGGSHPPVRPPVRSLYLHIPFCFHKCHYCDFYSIVDTQDRQDAFTARLIDELAALAPHAAGGGGLRTIFAGGGTPSLLRPDLWRRLLAALDGLFDLSLIRAGRDETGDRAEFTVECNPETVTPELMDTFVAGGVNRVSVGAQSFDKAHLATLERWHDPENVGRAVALARDAGVPRQSVDLIFGVPGQTRDDWRTDLSRALETGVTHLSCYALTYEPNTALTARLRAGRVVPADEDLEADLFETTVETLRAAGLRRYEVSNFARPGDESRHNLAYWRQEQWLAAGPSASGHVFGTSDPAHGGYRWKNVPRLGDYLASAGYSPVIDLEPPNPARALRERIMMGIRLAEGLDAAALLDYAARAVPSSAEPLTRSADRIARKGLLTLDAGRWALTDEGYLMADSVAAELMAAV